jgi:hypothetical protein
LDKIFLYIFGGQIFGFFDVTIPSPGPEVPGLFIDVFVAINRR